MGEHRGLAPRRKVGKTAALSRRVTRSLFGSSNQNLAGEAH